MTAATRDLAAELHTALDRVSAESSVDFFRQLADDYAAATRTTTAAESLFMRGRREELTVMVERALRMLVGGATDDERPKCTSVGCPDFGDPDFGEGTCPADHANAQETE